MRTVKSAFAQLERDQMAERTRTGLPEAGRIELTRLPEQYYLQTLFSSERRTEIQCPSSVRLHLRGIPVPGRHILPKLILPQR